MDKSREFIDAIEPQTHYYTILSSAEFSDEKGRIITPDRATELIAGGTIGKVIFHALHYYHLQQLARWKNSHPRKLTVAWVFWSYEFYQLPPRLSQLYIGFSKRLLPRKLVAFHVQHFMHFLAGKVPSPFFSQRYYRRGIAHVDEFYAFLEHDYFSVYGHSAATAFHFLAYLDENDVRPQPGIEQNAVPGTIMVGHSGSPIINHAEVIAALDAAEISSTVILPLSYGKPAYIRKLKQYLQTFDRLELQLLEQFLPKEEYYALIASVRYFFLNAQCQQALGNIVYFLGSDVAVYLSRRSSTYTDLVRQGFHVFAIEDFFRDKQLLELTPEQGAENRSRIGALLNSRNVSLSWSRLLHH
jgi:hypothetical protein